MLPRISILALTCTCCLLASHARGQDSAPRDKSGEPGNVDPGVRRIESLLRTIEFHGTTPREQAEVVRTIPLDRARRMVEDIACFEAAAKKAGTLSPKHRDALAALKVVLNQLLVAGPVLDAMAGELETLSRSQAELHPRMKTLFPARDDAEDDERVQLAKTLTALQKDVLRTMKKATELRATLSDTQKQRVDAMVKYSLDNNLVAKMMDSVADLLPADVPAPRRDAIVANAIKLQVELAGHTSQLAGLLRGPPEKAAKRQPRRVETPELKLQEDGTPTVVLLTDYFRPDNKPVPPGASLEDFQIDGLPVMIGGTMRVPYAAAGSKGLTRAFFFYRVLKKKESGIEPVKDLPWARLELPEIADDETMGKFDPRFGVFEKTPADKSVPFFVDRSRPKGPMFAGGRFHLKTSGLVDGAGKKMQIDTGDQIEYGVEVHGPEGTKPGRSETRIQSFGTIRELSELIQRIAEEERKLREIERRGLPNSR